MTKRILIVLGLVIGAPAHAEILSLICEHDSGVSAESGLPNQGNTEIFRIDFDVDKKKVLTPFFSTLDIEFSVDDYSVAWRVRLPSDDETYVYQLNRTTGTLFVDIVTAEDRFVAKGQCTKPKRLF